MPLPPVSVGLTPEEKFREYLASRPTPQRFTTQQRDLVNHLFQRHHHFDADQLLADVTAASLGVSRATVYRTLGKLVDAGLLRRLEIAGRTVYEHDYGYPQHEHFLCDRCGAMIEFQSSAIEPLLRDVAAANQFQMTGHTLVVRGMCAACNRARAAARPHYHV